MPVSFADRVIGRSDVLVRPVGDESVLLNLKTETYFGLDPSGARIWDVLLESDSIESACDALVAEFEVDRGQLHSDMEEFIDALIQWELVVIESREAGVV
jgi:Coenzyme PQQ synthesis protein D (PqqD)